MKDAIEQPINRQAKNSPITFAYPMYPIEFKRRSPSQNFREFGEGCEKLDSSLALLSQSRENPPENWRQCLESGTWRGDCVYRRLYLMIYFRRNLPPIS